MHTQKRILSDSHAVSRSISLESPIFLRWSMITLMCQRMLNLLVSTFYFTNLSYSFQNE